jgi:hypothetical protein
MGGISTRTSNSNNINARSLAADASLIPEQIATPASKNAIPVDAAQKLANGIQRGTMLANTCTPMRWANPKTMDGNPSIQRAAVVALARNGKPVGRIDV